jgi:hypothetical protein
MIRYDLDFDTSPVYHWIVQIPAERSQISGAPEVAPFVTSLVRLSPLPVSHPETVGFVLLSR